MVVISTRPTISAGNLQAYHATDPALSNAPFLVLYGPSGSGAANSANSARIHIHVFSPAGYQSYPKLAISPASPLYTAVSCLPQEEQGDEVVRALAYSLYKYFGDLPENAKDEWVQHGHRQTGGDTRRLYSAQHAADIASRLTPVENTLEVVHGLESAFTAQNVPCLDLDVVLPPGSIRELPKVQDVQDTGRSEEDELNIRYGAYAQLVKLFGETTFIPTSKIQRAPSRPTALNRSLTFAKKQKEHLRRELNEFVDTEESYVEKLTDLVHDVATSFREQARKRNPTSTSPDLTALESLFPPSADAILEVNTSLLDTIRQILDSTEEAAISDIEATPDSSSAVYKPANNVLDVTGATPFANALLDWYPKFASCYYQYIQAQPNFPRLIKTFTASAGSTFTKKLQEIGEQRLMSLLIEPVQRLPRYSLYIDNIIKQLPIRHPALKTFLKAKDIIANICDQDSEETGPAKKLARIKSIVSSWPNTFRPHGRFISAMDVVELGPLNELDKRRKDSSEMLMLLFAGHLVLIRKLGAHAMPSRSFMAEIDKSGPYLRSETGDPGLLFLTSKCLYDLNLSETQDGNILQFIPARVPLPKAIVSPNDDRIQQFRISGASEGRASKFHLDFVKARVEGRVSEEERDGPKWEARLVDTGQHDLALYSAIFEEGNEDVKHGPGRPGSIRLVVDADKGAKRLSPGEAGVEIVASISVEDQGFYRLDLEALNQRPTRDLVTETEFLPILIKRLGHLLQMRHQIRHPVATVYLLQHHAEILNSLVITPLQPERSNSTRRTKRPASPVKLLANLFGNVSLKDLDGPKLPPFALVNVPRLAAHQRTQSVPVFHARDKENQSPTRAAQLVTDVGIKSINSFELLEKTLSCYLLALQSRKGNVVGSVVTRRGFADEATVNQLYNALLENPADYERPAQAPVDVLFASFEQFLKTAWQERLGPVIASDILEDLQARMERLSPIDYEDYEDMRLAELAPQNRRALSAIIATLADLLHGTRNDGDRGALTAAFAEIVVCDANPHDFIPLFDRFVDNEELTGSTDNTNNLSVPGSVSSSMHHAKSGSVSSKASSLSRRLGFGSLRRENSKKDIGSLLRISSKKALPPNPPIEKPSFSRAHSQELSSHVNALRRPGSGDRSDSRPSTARSEQDLSARPSIEVTPSKQVDKVRKPRRSSLSDLTTLQTPGASPFWTDSASKQVNRIFESPSKSGSPLKLRPMDTPTKSASVRYYSPSKENIVPLNRWNSTKEGSPSRMTGNMPPPPSFAQAFAPLSSADQGHKRTSSQVSAQRGPLSESVASGNTPPISLHPSPSRNLETGSPKKLRIQSPAKIRERLDKNHSAVAGAQAAMQAEMDKIGLELAELDSKSSPEKTNQATITNLNTRLKALESRVSHFSKNLTEHAMTLEKDLNSSLQVVHRKNKALDAELQKANLENDVMFMRMNDEIAKVYALVQAGEGLEEMKRLLKDSQTEALKWKAEAAALKRENAALRSFVG